MAITKAQQAQIGAGSALTIAGIVVALFGHTLLAWFIVMGGLVVGIAVESLVVRIGGGLILSLVVVSLADRPNPNSGNSGPTATRATDPEPARQPPPPTSESLRYTVVSREQVDLGARKRWQLTIYVEGADTFNRRAHTAANAALRECDDCDYIKVSLEEFGWTGIPLATAEYAWDGGGADGKTPLRHRTWQASATKFMPDEKDASIVASIHTAWLESEAPKDREQAILDVCEEQGVTVEAATAALERVKAGILDLQPLDYPSEKVSGPSPKIVQEQVIADDLGDKWPLTVPRGFLRCEHPNAVSFELMDGTVYRVNGAAAQYPKITPIWAKDPDADPDGPDVRKNIGPLIDMGLELCKQLK